MTYENYELRRATDRGDLAAYHRIRRDVLFSARGRSGYDENYPDETNPNNWALLLLHRREPVCAFRLDIKEDCGIIRLMAVDKAFQRAGHGTAAITLLMGLAKRLSLKSLEVNSASDAVPFYQRQGFVLIDAARESPFLRLVLAGSKPAQDN